MIEVVTKCHFMIRRPVLLACGSAWLTFQQPKTTSRNFVQSVFDCLEGIEGNELVLGGTSMTMHVRSSSVWPRRLDLADHCRRPKWTILSTPAVSHLIRSRGAFGGIILSARATIWADRVVILESSTTRQTADLPWKS